MAKMLSETQTEVYGKELEKIVKELKLNLEYLLLKKGNLQEGFYQMEIARLGEVYADVQDLIKNSGYFEATKKALDENQDILTNTLEKAGRIVPNADFGGLSLEKLQAITDLDLSNIGNSQMMVTAEEIKQLLQQSVVNGVDFNTLVSVLEKKLEKDLLNNAKTLMATAKRQFTQSVENTLADEIGFGEDEEDMWEYFGDPLVKNSHAECVYALEQRPHPYFTNQQKLDFEAGIYPANLTGRSPIRYNCHHTFGISSMTKTEVEKKFGKVD